MAARTIRSIAGFDTRICLRSSNARRRNDNLTGASRGNRVSVVSLCYLRYLLFKLSSGFCAASFLVHRECPVPINRLDAPGVGVPGQHEVDIGLIVQSVECHGGKALVDV